MDSVTFMVLLSRRKYSTVPHKRRHRAKKESKQEIEQNQSRIYVYINKIYCWSCIIYKQPYNTLPNTAIVTKAYEYQHSKLYSTYSVNMYFGILEVLSQFF